jgi:sulfur carrier protein
MVSLRINGEDRSFDGAPTIEAVLELLKVPADAVAVEVNRMIVPRSTHAHHRLEDGDEMEVVTFVGGG